MDDLVLHQTTVSLVEMFILLQHAPLVSDLRLIALIVLFVVTTNQLDIITKEKKKHCIKPYGPDPTACTNFKAIPQSLISRPAGAQRKMTQCQFRYSFHPFSFSFFLFFSFAKCNGDDECLHGPSSIHPTRYPKK